MSSIIYTVRAPPGMAVPCLPKWILTPTGEFDHPSWNPPGDDGHHAQFKLVQPQYFIPGKYEGELYIVTSKINGGEHPQAQQQLQHARQTQPMQSSRATRAQQVHDNALRARPRGAPTEGARDPRRAQDKRDRTGRPRSDGRAPSQQQQKPGQHGRPSRSRSRSPSSERDSALSRDAQRLRLGAGHNSVLAQAHQHVAAAASNSGLTTPAQPPPFDGSAAAALGVRTPDDALLDGVDMTDAEASDPNNLQ